MTLQVQERAESSQSWQHCFEAAWAASPTRVLPVDAVIDPLVLTHASDRVAAYRDAMLRGERFPPISVVRLARRFLVADGHKRLAAFRSLGGAEIVVEVWPLRRWVYDQWRQLRMKVWQLAGLLRRSRRDAAARHGLTRLYWDTVGHWSRMFGSVRQHWQSWRR